MVGTRRLLTWPLLGVMLSGGLVFSDDLRAEGAPEAGEVGDSADYDVARANATSGALTASITSALADKPDADVVSQEDVRKMLSLEAERAVMGCDDEASCLAEISDALGARLVVSGRLTRVDRLFQLNLSVFDSTTATVAARKTVTGTTVDDVMEKVPYAVGQVWKQSGHQVKEEKVRAYVRDIDVDIAAFPLRAAGLSPWTIAGIQTCVGPCAACAASGLPGVACLLPCAGPGVFTLLSVWVGNWLGTERGTLGWPLLASYLIAGCTGGLGAALALGSIVGFITIGFLSLPAEIFADGRDPTQAELDSVAPYTQAAFLGGVAGLYLGILGTSAGLLTVPALYAWEAAPKPPDDEGASFPSFFASAAPSPVPEQMAPPRLRAAAIRF